MTKLNYTTDYLNIDFRQHPERYKIGKGEQGVLMAEPYKSEILPHWRFRTPEIAQQSAEKIYQLYLDYKAENDFVGMDMARKFLQMGFTRARRYANHPDGKKYKADGSLIPQQKASEQSPKAESARIFYSFYVKVKDDPDYQEQTRQHKQQQCLK